MAKAYVKRDLTVGKDYVETEGGGGGGGISYSTEEKVIGTWIDGNPLYQKTVVIELGTSRILYDYEAGCNMLEVRGTIKATDGYIYDLSLLSCDSTKFWIEYWSPRIGIVPTSKVYNGTLTMTLNYTKTTD